MKHTKIEWADHTFNPWIGCAKISPACDNCYAEVSMPAKMQRVAWGQNAERHRTSKSNWLQPLRWNAEAERTGIRQRVFCASLADVFDNAVHVQWRIDLMRLIVDTPHLTWLLLTKRIGNAASMLETAFRAVHAGREGWADNVPPNVWIGATICNQEEADRDIPKLLAVPAAKRFLSMEPLLGPVDLRLARRTKRVPWWCGDDYPSPSQSLIDWVIVGGESGPNARPMHPEWARSLRDQCKAAGVPFFFKQWGEWVPMMGHAEGVPAHGPKHTHQDGTIMGRAGKKAAGRLLDGRKWDGIPEGGAA